MKLWELLVIWVVGGIVVLAVNVGIIVGIVYLVKHIWQG